jgi:hypothetical protein
MPTGNNISRLKEMHTQWIAINPRANSLDSITKQPLTTASKAAKSAAQQCR